MFKNMVNEITIWKFILSLQQVYVWDRKFKISVSSVADATCSGQLHTAKTPETA